MLGTHRLPSQSRLPWVPLKHSKGVKGSSQAAQHQLQHQGPALSSRGWGLLPGIYSLWHVVPPQTLGGLGGQEHTYLWSSHPTEAWGALEDMEVTQ